MKVKLKAFFALFVFSLFSVSWSQGQQSVKGDPDAVEWLSKHPSL